MFPLDCFSSSVPELWNYYHQTMHVFIMHKRSTYSNTNGLLQDADNKTKWILSINNFKQPMCTHPNLNVCYLC